MKQDEVILWIKDTLREKGKTQKDLAEWFHKDPGAITRMMRGEREMKVSELQGIVRFLQRDAPPNLFRYADIAGPPLPPTIDLAEASVIGTVEAGVWRERELIPRNVKRNVFVAKDARFPNAPYFASEVLDGSFSAVIPQGHLAIWIPIEAINREPQDRDILIVEREKGSLVEQSIRRARLAGGLLELSPEPATPGPWASFRVDSRTGRQEGDDAEVRIVGLVVSAFVQF